MTQATINGKRVSLSIYEKAARLNVYEVAGQAGYTVTSGSDASKAYRVSEDCGECNCDSRVLCSHRVAAQSHKNGKRIAQEQEENARCNREMMFDPRFQ